MNRYWLKRKTSLNWSNGGLINIFLLALLSLVIFVFNPLTASSDTAPKERKAIIILVNSVTWQDLEQANLPFFKRFVGRSTLALSSPRTAATDATIYRSYATLGAGSRAQASKIAALGFNQGEVWEGLPVTDWYQTLTGRKPKGEVLHLGLPNLEKENEKVHYRVLPGALGEKLKRAGLKTAVLGNADTSRNMVDKSFHREAVLIAMDRKGTVDFGSVGKKMTMANRQAPFGLQTDYSKLTSDFWQAFKKANLIVIETGDTYRVDLFSPLTSERLLKRYKTQALKQIDTFLAQIVPSLSRENTLLIISSPSPPKALKQPDGLTPVILWGGGFKNGLATSASTKRVGLISNVDLAPTVLNHFSIEPPSYFLGRKITSRFYERERFRFLNDFSVRSLKNDYLQPIMIISYIIFTSVIFLFALAYLLIVKIKQNRWVSSLSGLLLVVLALPLSYFLLPLVVPTRFNVGWFFIGSLFLSLLLILGAWYFRGKVLGSVGFLALATTILIGVDLMSGANLNINTIFGYSPIVGGRFYGLGNQALAILLASTLLSSVLWLEWRGKWDRVGKIGVIFFFFLVVLVVGFPGWGADVGGTITTIAAFSATYLSLLKKKIAAKNILLIVLGVILVLSLFAVIDIYQLKTGETHLGRTVELVQAEGNSAFIQVIQRKLATNLRIIRYSSWSYFSLIILALLIFLRFRPLGQFQKLLSNYSYLGAGISGAFVGGVVGFLTNDSGIVIPALILAYFTAAIFYLMIQNQAQANSR